MRTKTLEIKIYSFADLQANEDLKQRAIDKYRQSDMCQVHWASEMKDAHNQAWKQVYTPLGEIFEEISGVRLYKWIQNNISWRWTNKNRISKHENGSFKNSYFAYKYDKCLKYRVSKVFETNNLENCPFTGVCYDFDFLQPVIDFLKNPSSNISNHDLARNCPTVKSVYDRELEYIESDEAILIEFESNQYEFNEDGSIH